MKLVCIVGPTSSGKTDIAVAVARSVGGEVLSADSRQVYRGLDLGSGKATKEEMRGVPHHMLDVADPKESYTAADFVRDGSNALQAIRSRGTVPIIAGGTGFYIDALLKRVSLANVPPDASLREELGKKTLKELQKILETDDPERYATIDVNNPRRLVRAIEIASANTEDRPLCNTEVGPLCDVVWIGLAVPSNELREKIRVRLKERLARGMLEEAKRLHEEGVSYERMEALGLEYRYMARHLSGTLTYEEMSDELFREIVKYAKRQMTWFKKNEHITWFSPTDVEKIIQHARAFIQTKAG